MNTQDRIQELQEKMDEFILNESVFADDHPSWGELADAQAVAEAKWNRTAEGRELKALLAKPIIQYISQSETHYTETHAQAFEYLISWLKANESKVSDVSAKIDTNGVEHYIRLHYKLRKEV